jgi:hypothetical protein
LLGEVAEVLGWAAVAAPVVLEQQQDLLWLQAHQLLLLSVVEVPL